MEHTIVETDVDNHWMQEQADGVHCPFEWTCPPPYHQIHSRHSAATDGECVVMLIKRCFLRQRQQVVVSKQRELQVERRVIHSTECHNAPSGHYRARHHQRAQQEPLLQHRSSGVSAARKKAHRCAFQRRSLCPEIFEMERAPHSDQKQEREHVVNQKYRENAVAEQPETGGDHTNDERG